MLIFYGSRGGPALDAVGLECIEAAREQGARTVVCTVTDTQRGFVKSMGFGDAIRGVFSVPELERREGDRFDRAWALRLAAGPARQRSAPSHALEALP